MTMSQISLARVALDQPFKLNGPLNPSKKITGEPLGGPLWNLRLAKTGEGCDPGSPKHIVKPRLDPLAQALAQPGVEPPSPALNGYLDYKKNWNPMSLWEDHYGIEVGQNRRVQNESKIRPKRN
jgi:hypothetical protein